MNPNPGAPKFRSWIMFGQAHAVTKHETTMRARIPGLLTIAVEMSGHDVKDDMDSIKQAGLTPVEPDCVLDFRTLKLHCKDYVTR